MNPIATLRATIGPNRLLSHRSVNLRCVLHLAIAASIFLVADSTWKTLVGPVGVMFTGLVGVVCTAWRGFLDQSESRREPTSGPATESDLAVKMPPTTGDVKTE